MTWVCVTCRKPATVPPQHPTLTVTYRTGWCESCHVSGRTFRYDGEGRKQRGMALAETAEAIGGEWVNLADRAIYRLAHEGAPFSAEDVARLAGRPTHPNAMGARINAAARKGLIVKAGTVTASRPERHRNEMRLWRGA